MYLVSIKNRSNAIKMYYMYLRAYWVDYIYKQVLVFNAKFSSISAMYRVYKQDILRFLCCVVMYNRILFVQIYYPYIKTLDVDGCHALSTLKTLRSSICVIGIWNVRFFFSNLLLDFASVQTVWHIYLMFSIFPIPEIENTYPQER